MELIACEWECASSKMLKLKKRIVSRIPHRKIHTEQLSGAFLNNYVEFTCGSASSFSDVTFYNLKLLFINTCWAFSGDLPVVRVETTND